MSQFQRPERIEYGDRSLERGQLDDDPMKAFGEWFREAVEYGVPEANAMCLCTCGEGASPDGRVVLLKGFDSRGFVFYTNYESVKAHQLTHSSRVALVFWWQALRRQIRIQGVVEKVPSEESDEYFSTRPQEARYGAWASRQSERIASRERLLDNVVEAKERFGVADVPRPPYWGGYLVCPSKMEFWQGRDSRLHDRIEYRKLADGWATSRLMP